MSLITRFNGAFKAFASEATGTFRTVFGGTTQSNDLTDNLTSNFKTGWEIVGTNDEPTIEDFNAMGYTLSQVLAYIHQVGIIEWSGTDGVVGGQDYYAGKSFVGYGGDIYVALLNNGGSVEARVPTNETYWGKVGDIKTVTINATSDADITLTSLQNQYGRFVITDIGVLLTTTRNVIVGTAQKRFLVQNNTAQNLVFKTSGGSGITVLAGEKADLYCDGTNVIDSFFTYKNPAFNAFLGADLILSAATFTKVPFVDTYGYDAIGNFDNTNYRFQPNKAGIYHVSGGLRFNTTDITQIIVYKNGVGYRYLHYGTSAANLFNGNSIDVYLNGTSDYIELYARSNNANTVLNSGGNVGESSATFFQAHFAGAL